MRDLGPLAFSPARRSLDGGFSVLVNQRSVWIFWKLVNTLGSIGIWGSLEEASLQKDRPRLLESDASIAGATLLPLTPEELKFNADHAGKNCATDCGSQWILSGGQ